MIFGFLPSATDRSSPSSSTSALCSTTVILSATRMTTRLKLSRVVLLSGLMYGSFSRTPRSCCPWCQEVNFRQHQLDEPDVARSTPYSLVIGLRDNGSSTKLPP